MPARRVLGISVVLCALLTICVLSLAIGALPLTPAAAWHGLTDPSSAGYAVVHQMRLPRTLLGLLAGTALGLAGAVMQALTRNPLADPGLLGVNAGASAAVVTATALLGISTLGGYIWFALAGAAIVSVLIYAVGGGGSSTPARLALAGTAVNAALYSYVGAVELLDTGALDRMRFGDDLATGLGLRGERIRLLTLSLAVALAATAASQAGPVAFVALCAPHLARSLTRRTGPNLVPTLLLGAALMEWADYLARQAIPNRQLPVGVVTGVLGGGYLVYLLARQRQVVQ